MPSPSPSSADKGSSHLATKRRDPLRGVKPLQGSLLALHIASPLRPSDWQPAGTRALNSTFWMAAGRCCRLGAARAAVFRNEN